MAEGLGVAEGLALRYGANPHQTPARAYRDGGPLPFVVRNGAPGYVNLLDALNAWQLVRELRAATGLAAAASFKHVSPAGAAVAAPLSDAERAACFAPRELSPVATAYARARGADRVSSYGDWIALSDPVDETAARLIRPEVSDGVIAPGYAPAALGVLAAKKGGAYHVLEIDAGYRPPPVERRTVFGVTLEQARNDCAFDVEALAAAGLPPAAARDLAVGLIALKYTQSNAVCLCARGQTVGVAAGQQSRIACTRLAIAKARTWLLRQHPQARALRFRGGVRRADRDTAIAGYVDRGLRGAADRPLAAHLRALPEPIAAADERRWVAGFPALGMCSDGFLPHRDNVDAAAGFGVRYLAQPGGSSFDAAVEAACREHGISMVKTGVRLFHH